MLEQMVEIEITTVQWKVNISYVTHIPAKVLATNTIFQRASAFKIFINLKKKKTI